MLRKIETVQKNAKLNDVYSIDSEGPGKAHHSYLIVKEGTDTITPANEVGRIDFQCGARKEENSISGVLDADLLEIVRDRLKSFQSGPFACEENAKQLEHVEKALYYANQRVENRLKRGVLGTYNK